jgi:hypothetical protein
MPAALKHPPPPHTHTPPYTHARHRYRHRRSIYPEGCATTLDPADLPYLRAALQAPASSLYTPAAGLTPEYDTVELLSAQFPSLSLEELLVKLDGEARLDGRYFLCNQEQMLDTARALRKVRGVARVRVCACPSGLCVCAACACLFAAAAHPPLALEPHKRPQPPAPRARRRHGRSHARARAQVKGLSLQDQFMLVSAPIDVFNAHQHAALMDFASTYASGQPVLFNEGLMPAAPPRSELQMAEAENLHKVC